MQPTDALEQKVCRGVHINIGTGRRPGYHSPVPESRGVADRPIPRMSPKESDPPGPKPRRVADGDSDQVVSAAWLSDRGYGHRAEQIPIGAEPWVFCDRFRPKTSPLVKVGGLMARRENPTPDDGEWVTAWVVRHWRSGKLIRRHDGKPFRFKRRK